MKDLYMFQEQYIETLKRQLALIEGGMEPVSVDSDTMGAKETAFTWGLCSNRRETYPTQDLHLFPEDFESHGRIAPKYYRDDQPCPLDMRTDKQRETDGNGCYYTCGHFQAYKHPEKLTRETVVERYKERLIKTEAQ